MTDTQTTVERIESANAVPSPDAFPSGALSSTDLLARIDTRSKTMTETLTPIRATDPVKRPGRGRGPLIALAVAAVILLVIGVTSFTILSNDDAAPPATDPPATTTTIAPTTTVTATTVAPIEGVLPADTPPLEVVAALHAAWDAGDMDAADALINPDSGYFSQNQGPGIAEEIWYRSATNMVVYRECSIDAAPFAAIGLPLGDGVAVSCKETLISGLQPGRPVGGGFFGAEVNNGMITNFYIDEYTGGRFENEGLDLYRSWVSLNDSDAYEALFAVDTTIVVDTAAARAQHNETVAVFVAAVAQSATGPRAEGALSANTGFLEVVTTFLERWDAGDIEGYEAIFHPDSGYVSGSNSEDVWYNIVTGVVSERDCTLVTATRVQCAEKTFSGLEPGTVIDEFTTIWHGDAGYLWTVGFRFPDGSPEAFTSPVVAPGAQAYLDWVKENEPDLFDDLFVGGLSMKLDTEDARNAHTELVARFLAATNQG